MRLGPRTLKVAAGLGTAGVVAGGAVAVAADARPGGAPLRPPVSGAPTTTTVAAQDGTAGGDALVIPVTPVCQRGTAGTAGNQAPAVAATPAAPTDPAVGAAVQKLRAATTAADRQAVYSTLSPDQRMQLTAYLSALRQLAGGAARTQGAGCRGVGPTPPVSPSSGSITPTVVAGGPVSPLIVTTVS